MLADSSGRSPQVKAVLEEFEQLQPLPDEEAPDEHHVARLPLG
jgi:hypothetical protein